MDHDIRASVSIPSISVLRYIDASTVAGNVDIVENNIGGVGNEVVVLGRISQHQVSEN